MSSTALLLIGLIGLLALAGAAFFLLSRGMTAGDSSDDLRYLQDREDPLRRFAHGLMALYQGDVGDPGYWQTEQARAQMIDGWGIPDAGALDELLQSYHDGEVNVGFDQARIIWLSRLGSAAGFLSEAESWHHVEKAVLRVQGGYGRWSDVADAIASGIQEWFGGESQLPSSEPERIARCREQAEQQVLPEVPFS